MLKYVIVYYICISIYLRMKYLFTITFLLFSTYLLGQEVEKTIILKDETSNLPIEDASVLVLKSKQLNLSNTEGKVSFVIKGISTIQITHTSYISQTIRSTSLKEKETVIYLKSNFNKLDEIILTKQHPQKILATLIENSSKKLTVPARLKVYAREFFKLNGAYSNYNDGLMNFQLSGKPNDFKTTILVEQNRSFGLVDESINDELVGYNLNNIMQNYYNFKYLNPLLEPRAKKEFDFLIKAHPVNEDYYVMSAIPADNSAAMLDDYAIVYDRKRKIIIEVSATISPTSIAKAKDSNGKNGKTIYKSFFKTMYRFDSNYYYLISSKEEIGYEKIFKKKTTDIEVRNYFVTTNFSNQNYSFKESEVFKDKTLFNKKNTILSNYWELSGLVATEEEEEIIKEVQETD